MSVGCVCQEAGRAEGFLSWGSRSDSGDPWGLEGASKVVLMVKNPPAIAGNTRDSG